jgi:hypothetical protein
MKKWFIPFFLMYLAGCGKSDVTAPMITLNHPAEDQVFSAGETVMVSAVIQDDNDIHTVHLTVTDNTGAHYIHFEDHFDGKTYTLNKSFTTQAGKTYSIHVDATDHAENMGELNRVVSAN